MRMIWNLFVHAVATAFALLVVTAFVPGVDVSVPAAPLVGDGEHDRLWVFLGVGAIIVVLNTLVKPVVQLIGLPLTILTLGLFSLVINAAMLLLAAAVAQSVGLGLTVSGFWAAVFGSIVLGLVNAVVSPITAGLTRR